MSVLNIPELNNQVDKAVREKVLMKTAEGREQLLHEEFTEGLKQFEGWPITEQTLYTIKAWYSEFGEHVNCKFGLNNQFRSRIDGDKIVGSFDYQPMYSITYKSIVFSLR